MPESPCLIPDHIVPALESGTYGKPLEWENRRKQIFRIPWYGEYRPGTRNWRNEYGEWCLDWDRKKGRTVEYTSKCIGHSKERIRNALRKSKLIKDLPVKDGCRRYQVVGFKVGYSSSQQLWGEDPPSVGSVCESDTSGYESENLLTEQNPFEHDTVHNMELPESVDKINKSVSPCPDSDAEVGNSGTQDLSRSSSLECSTNQETHSHTSHLPFNENVEIGMSCPTQDLILKFSGWNTLVELPSGTYMDHLDMNTLSLIAGRHFLPFQPTCERGFSQSYETNGNDVDQMTMQNVLLVTGTESGVPTIESNGHLNMAIDNDAFPTGSQGLSTDQISNGEISQSWGANGNGVDQEPVQCLQQIVSVDENQSVLSQGIENYGYPTDDFLKPVDGVPAIASTSSQQAGGLQAADSCAGVKPMEQDPPFGDEMTWSPQCIEESLHNTNFRSLLLHESLDFLD